MDGSLTRWDNWSAEQWLEEASRFDKMALRFDHHPQLNASFRALARDAIVRAKDGRLTEAQVVRGTHWLHPHRRHPATRPMSSDAEYFRRRTAQEERAAQQSRDIRVRRVHLEMAERYRACHARGKRTMRPRFALFPSAYPRIRRTTMINNRLIPDRLILRDVAYVR